MASSVDAVAFPVALPDLPSDWEYALLGDLVEDRGICYGIVQPGTVSEEGTPVIRVNNVRNGRIDASDVLRVDRAVEAKFQRSRLRGGEVLLTLVGTLGEVAIVPDTMSGWNVARAVGVLPVLQDPGSRWVAICLRSALCQHCIRSWATTTVQATFNLRDVANLPIPLPPARLREKIAHILGTLDDKIELNRRMNATLEGISRAIFKSWFVDFDPVRQKAAGKQPVGMDAQTAAMFPDSFEDSEIGEVPKGWQRSSLDSLFPSEDCVITGPFGSTLHASDYRDSGTPLILVKHVVDGRFVDTETMPLVGAHKAIELARYLVEAGDIVFTRVGAVGRSAYVSASDVGRLISGQMLRVRIPRVDVIDPRFLAQAFIEPSFIAMVEGHALGTTRPSLNTGLLKSFRFVVPGARLTTVFAQMVSPKDALRQQLTVQSTTLAALRDTLLPKLLSGEIRVPEAEGMVEEAVG